MLGDGGVGVISLAEDDEPYAVPVSYGYDSDDRGIYVRFGFAADSTKRRFVDEGETAVLVVTEEAPDGWRSVLARGPLSTVAEPALDGRAARSIRKITIPFVSIYEHDPAELSFELYRLSPETLTGRKEA